MASTDQIVSRPILVVGTHRSGTTLLGRALGHHPEVAYWEEPRHVFEQRLLARIDSMWRDRRGPR